MKTTRYVLALILGLSGAVLAGETSSTNNSPNPIDLSLRDRHLSIRDKQDLMGYEEIKFRAPVYEEIKHRTFKRGKEIRESEEETSYIDLDPALTKRLQQRNRYAVFDDTTEYEPIKHRVLGYDCEEIKHRKWKRESK